MKHKVIPSFHGLVIIIFCVLIVGAFIYLSTSKLDRDVEMIDQTIDMEKIYDKWDTSKPKYEMKRVDVSYKYDTRQVDDVHIINYEITNDVGEKKITPREVEVLLNCYKNKVCEDIDISKTTEYIINNYKHFLIKDDFVIVYGLYPDRNKESFGEIESNIFIINEHMFANIVNPIYSKTNKKYDKIRKDFLLNNANIEYENILNKKRMAKKEKMNQAAIDEILNEKAIYVKDDIKLLEIIAKSISFSKQENN